jgi:hypothetical protein
MFLTKQSLSFLLLVLIMPLALAESYYAESYYAGLEGGISDVRHKDFDDSKSYRVYGAYRINSYFSVELGYADLGTFKLDKSNLAAKVAVDEVVDLTLAVNSLILPGNPTEFEFKASYYYAGLDVALVDSSDTDDDSGLGLATGLVYPIDDQWDLNGTWRYYRNIGGVDFNNYQLGLRFNF